MSSPPDCPDCFHMSWLPSLSNSQSAIHIYKWQLHQDKQGKHFLPCHKLKGFKLKWSYSFNLTLLCHKAPHLWINMCIKDFYYCCLVATVSYCHWKLHLLQSHNKVSFLPLTAYRTPLKVTGAVGSKGSSLFLAHAHCI